jgi:hypothetical protein
MMAGVSRFKKVLLLFSFCISVTAVACAETPLPNPTAILPSDTDPRISTFNDPHMTWRPAGRPRNQLLIFLPGTGAKPKENFPFAKMAASLGYHVICLMYPDNLASQKKCGNSPDPQAYIKFRLAIIRGGILGPHRRIDPPDSIENRLARVLMYLQAKQSQQGWGQFLDSHNNVDWNKIVISGSSQGGGHAYMIAKYHKVARVIMFASPKDFSFYFKKPAVGFDGHTSTPLDRFFAFNHLEDNGNGCTHDQQSQILKQIGLDRFGTTNADQPTPNYNHARLIYSDEQLPDKRYHGSVSKGFLRVCPAVWRYMLTEPVQ